MEKLKNFTVYTDYSDWSKLTSTDSSSFRKLTLKKIWTWLCENNTLSIQCHYQYSAIIVALHEAINNKRVIWWTGNFVFPVFIVSWATSRRRPSFPLATLVAAHEVASSRRSVSQGAEQKTAREKIKKKRSERKREETSLASSRCAFFYFFARCFLLCALTNWTPGRGYSRRLFLTDKRLSPVTDSFFVTWGYALTRA